MDYQPLYQHDVYREARDIVLFCNQTAYDHDAREYLFDHIIGENKMRRLLIPEHGLFSEYQDQVAIDSMTYRGIPCTSLYDKKRNITGPAFWMLEGADTLIIDVQDAGVRFFTYITHMFDLLRFVAEHRSDVQVIVNDRPNPAGTRVEGTPLAHKYRSFLGYPGMLHRHGMSIRQLCQWLIRTYDLSLRLHYIPVAGKGDNYQYISPSPNLPVRESLSVYPGQCFWEATTFSEGRGTTRPFTLVGHPALSPALTSDVAQAFNRRFEGLAHLRPTAFIPVFHKHQGSVCNGWQLHPENPSAYHSVFGSLWLMQQTRSSFSEPFWREGSYEFDSPCTAAQLLLGDDLLIQYVEGQIHEEEVTEWLAISEQNWSNESFL